MTAEGISIWCFTLSEYRGLRELNDSFHDQLRSRWDGVFVQPCQEHLYNRIAKPRNEKLLGSLIGNRHDTTRHNCTSNERINE